MQNQTIPQTIVVTLPMRHADLVLTAYLSCFSSQGKMQAPNAVAFDFHDDANEYKEYLAEAFGIEPAEMSTVVSFTKKRK